MVFSHSNRKVADTDEKLTCIGHFPLNWFAFEPSRQQAGKGSTEPSHTHPFAQGACHCRSRWESLSPCMLLSPHCGPCLGWPGSQPSLQPHSSSGRVPISLAWCNNLQLETQHAALLKVLLRETKPHHCFKGA